MRTKCLNSATYVCLSGAVLAGAPATSSGSISGRVLDNQGKAVAVVVLESKVSGYRQAVQADHEDICTEGMHPCCGGSGHVGHSPFPSGAVNLGVSEPCCDHHDGPAFKRRFTGVMRFLAWCAAFSGIYAMGAVCPFCGRQGCPTGMVSAGLVGLVFASLMHWGRLIRSYLTHR